jgi:ribosome-binding protein aMBF1 (putative translation factor)
MNQKKQKRIEKGTPAAQVLEHITGNDPTLRAAIKEQKLNVRVAEMIHEARTGAGLSQAQLAKLIGTSQSVISRLEDADYDGHSLTMLQRIADALHRRLDVRMLPMSA